MFQYGSISLPSLVLILQRGGLYPDPISTDILCHVIAIIKPGNEAAGRFVHESGSTTFSYSDFLLLLCCVIDISEEHCLFGDDRRKDPSSSKEERIVGCTYVVLHAASMGLMNTMLSIFRNTNVEKYLSFQRRDQLQDYTVRAYDILELHINSVLWMARQAGLTRYKLSMSRLLQVRSYFETTTLKKKRKDSDIIAPSALPHGLQIVHDWFVDSVKTGSGRDFHSDLVGEEALDFDTLPPLLARLAEDAAQFSVDADRRPAGRLARSGHMPLLGAVGDDAASCAFYVATEAPGMLFSSPSQIPSVLLHLHTARTTRCLDTELAPVLKLVLHTCLAHEMRKSPSADIFRDFSEMKYRNFDDLPVDMVVTLEAYLEACTEAALVPELIVPSAITALCAFVLGITVEKCSNQSQLYMGEFLELLYATSQVCYGTKNTSKQQAASFHQNSITAGDRNIASSVATERIFEDPLERFRWFLLQFDRSHRLSIANKLERDIFRVNPEAQDVQMTSLLYIEKDPLLSIAHMFCSSSGVRRPFTPRTTRGPSDLSRLFSPSEKLDAEHTMLEISSLLMHIPLNDLSFTPWKVSSIFFTDAQPINCPEDLTDIL